MTNRELLLRLNSLGIKLWVEGDAIQFAGPRGALTEDLREALRARKSEIRELLVREAEGGKGTSLAPIPAAARDGVLPASSAQRRLWFLEQVETGAEYIMSFALELAGELDVEAMRRSIEGLVGRHEALRTTFAVVADELVQEIHAPAPVSLEAVDVAGTTLDERRAEVRRLAEASAARPFDLARGPLLRTTLLRVAEREHVLVFSMHHIIADGASMHILLDELGVLYSGFREGREPVLPPLQLQYADFAAWERASLDTDASRASIAYFRERLAGVEPITLPFDRQRDPAAGRSGGVHAFTLDATLSDALRRFGRAHGATSFVTLLAASNVLLSRYSAQANVCVGIPVANRDRTEFEKAVGFFVNTLVVRTDMADDPSFIELLARARDNVLDAQAHKDLPFDRLTQALGASGEAGHSPLFQVMFTVDLAEESERSLPGLTLRMTDVLNTTTKFDFFLSFREHGETFEARFGYDTGLFDAATVERMASSFVTLVQAIVAAPERRISELPLLTGAERQRLIVDWNATERAFPRDLGVADLFEMQAAWTPEAMAVSFGEHVLSYRELDSRANQLAHHLYAEGVLPGALVATCLERSLDLIIAFVAILKCGAAYLPLDPDYPKERLAFMITDAGVDVVVTSDRGRESLPGNCARWVRVDEDWSAIAARPIVALPRTTDPMRTAYVNYTSGSTGIPKGIAIPERAVVRLVRGTDYVQVEPSDRVAHVSSASFDAATFEIWGALLNGARLVVIAKDTAITPAHFADALRTQKVTTLFLTTALFNQMVREAPGAFSGLRHLLFGGELVDVRPVRELLANGAPQRLLHVYGPTESTTFATYHVVTPSTVTNTVPIGRPIANTQVFVLDRHLEPVPVGVVGEIYIGGDGLASGYVGRPELTAERFVSSPYGRLYKTGDLGRLLTDGSVVFSGRCDDQVKLRGFRIELGEIEAKLRSLPNVEDAVVMVREDTPGDRRLVAYLASASSLFPMDVREDLRRSLPDYMIPAAIVVLPALPVNCNGKVDRPALPAPTWAAPADSYVAPRTAEEDTLAKLFGAVLGIERVGIHDDFFELGGHSLLATQLVSRTREALGVPLPMRALFEARTVAALAERLGQTPRDATLVPIGKVNRRGPLHLSFAQQRLWILDQLEPGTAAYNVSLAIRVAGALGVEALRRALEALVLRHEALRTTFTSIDGVPRQIVHAPEPWALPVIVVSGASGEWRERRVAQLAEEEDARPFDLATGPVLRTTLLRLEETSHVLLLSMHHIVSDGWSMGVMFRELGALYAAEIERTDAALPELPIQYSDFAAWQRSPAVSEVLDRQVAYWRERLAGARALELPSDFARPTQRTYRGAHHTIRLDGALTASIDALGQSCGATRFMTLLAAFQEVARRYSRQEDFCIGTSIANRNRAETEGLIGFFVNQLVLRCNVEGDVSFLELLRRTRETALDAYAHQDAPFERIVEELVVARDPSRTPLFQVAFTLQNAPMSELALAGLTLTPMDGGSGTSKFDLLVVVEEEADALVCHLCYSTDLFKAATIHGLAEHYEMLLRAIVASPERRVSELSMVSEGERRRLLGEWSPGITDELSPTACVHEMFAAQAARTPDAPAVAFEGTTLTFAELDARTNRLAHHLRSLGVGPEVPVGICLDRSVELIVALLAIWKAGGAYVPLDPEYPAERLAIIMAEAHISVLLTAEALADELPVGPAFVVCLDDSEAFAHESPLPLPSTVTPANVAYVLFTSGSTGQPKGVAIEHRNVSSYVAAAVERLGLRGGLQYGLVSTFSADLGHTVLLPSLCIGGCLHVIDEERAMNGEKLAAYAREQGLDVLKIVPSHLAALLASSRAEVLPRECLVLGGEAASWELLEQIQRLAPACRVFNHYGPTETTVGVLANPLTPLASKGRPVIPALGRPLPRAKVYLLDERLQPVGAGVVGEVYIGGASVGRGYQGKAALTAERFVPDPFSAEPGARMYRSGDLGRHLSDGSIVFLGRVDHQLKLHGYRIELGEIEAVFSRHAAVKQTIAMVRDDGAGGPKLVAYVVLEDGVDVAVSSLREYAKQRLPAVMVPSAIVVLEAMPLSPNGKVERRALPPPERVAPSESTRTLPRTPSEEALARIWCEVLGLEQVNVEDNFFDIGGSSLLLARVLSRISAELGRDVSMVDMFRYTTLSALATHLDSDGAGPVASPNAGATLERLRTGRERLAMRRGMAS